MIRNIYILLLLSLSFGTVTDIDGNIPRWTSTGIFILNGLSEMQSIPDAFSLSNVYPNPFNPITTLEFGIPIDGNVSIEVYNIQGRMVKVLTDRLMDAGYHSVTWNADSYSSGVYFVKMVAGEFVNTQKLMLVK